MYSQTDANFLAKQAKQMFDRPGLLSLWQTMAENFHPPRADFTVNHTLGDDLMNGLLSSYPIIAHRDLTGVLATMLRRDEWFKLNKGGINGGSQVGHTAKKWLEEKTNIMRRRMYEPTAGITKATRQADGDFTLIGQGVITAEMQRDRSGLLYRTWHPRDVAWTEGEDGQVANPTRTWRPYAGDLCKMFKDSVSAKTKQIAEKDPFTRIECYHMVRPVDYHNESKLYDGSDVGDHPYISTYIEVGQDGKEGGVLEQKALYNKMYIIPRFQTVSGSPYAYSPAALAALPDARLLQAMTNTLLEAGEKATNPPMIAQEGVLRGDIGLFAGGMTYIDRAYDERAGVGLRPMPIDTRGLPIGMDQAGAIREEIADSFFLNKLMLPSVGSGNMTAYEVSQRMDEWVRHTLPLFEPMEAEYNGQLCDITFELMMNNGDFGSPMDIPKELQGEEVVFTFESPISQAIERKKGAMYTQMSEMLAIAAQNNQLGIHEVDGSKALRDALTGIGVPQEWQRTEEAAQQMQAVQQAVQLATMAEAG